MVAAPTFINRCYHGSKKPARREMRSGTYRPHVGLHMAIVGAVVLGAFVVALYLVDLI